LNRFYPHFRRVGLKVPVDSGGKLVVVKVIRRAEWFSTSFPQAVVDGKLPVL